MNQVAGSSPLLLPLLPHLVLEKTTQGFRVITIPEWLFKAFQSKNHTGGPAVRAVEQLSPRWGVCPPKAMDGVSLGGLSPRWGVCPEKAMDGVCVSGLSSAEGARARNRQDGEAFSGLSEKLLEEAIPGILDLVTDVVRLGRPVFGFQTILREGDELHRQIILDAESIEPVLGNPRVSILIQDFPAEKISWPADSPAIFHGLVGKSSGMMRVFHKIRLYGAVDSPVIVLGETGSGKEGVAHALHQLSSRKKSPFIPVNCTAISENLFESELFGHDKGSFTGAIKYHKGRFERANGGTLFLDEIGDLSLPSQAKLLRILEDGVVERVGSEQPFRVDVRIIAATNKNLDREITLQTFRADLFYRINALQIHIPPLRDRAVDIPLLVKHFVEQLNKKYDRQVFGLSPEALRLLQQYKWPGNVRELRNLLERLFAENQTEMIGLRSLKEWYDERVRAAKDIHFDPNVTVLPYRNVIELGMDNRPETSTPSMAFSGHTPHRGDKPVLDACTIKKAYAEAHGNITKAAALLGIHKATFYRALKTLNLSRGSLTST